MKKKKLLLPIIAVSLLASLSACNMISPSSSTNKPESTPTAQTPSTTKTLVEVTDCEDIESGDYIINGNFVTVDKSNKKITAMKYENNDYNKYKAKDGTKVFELDIKFVEFNDTHAVYYKNDNAEYFLIKSGTSFYQYKRVDGVLTYNSFYKMPVIVNIEYGEYVSTKQNDYVYDDNGNKVPNGEGGYQKHDFYYHVDLREKSVKVYVSDNDSTHNDTVVYQIENYALVVNAGGLAIKIPKTEFDFSITFTEKGIRFTDSSGQGSRYSGSGTLTKKA